MRLVLALAALAASASVASAANYPPRPKCTPAGTKQFVDALNKASDGCTATNTYEWDGNNDPTVDQRTAFCNCDIAPFNIPMCSWTKAVYNVSVNEHFHYVYNCDSLGGKQAPNVTEVPAQVGTVAPSTAPTTAPSTSGTCNEVQMSMFTTSLKSSSPCIAASTYDWSGSADPTDAQLSEICKCSVGSTPTLPSCTLTKAGTKVSLSEHYNWVMKTKCPQVVGSEDKKKSSSSSEEHKSSSSSEENKSSSSTEDKKSSGNTVVAGLTGGVIGGVVVAIVLVIAFVVYMRKRSTNLVQYPDEDASSARTPAPFQPLNGAPQPRTTRTDGVRTVPTTIPTTNGRINDSRKGNGSFGSGASGRSTRR